MGGEVLLVTGREHGVRIGRQRRRMPARLPGDDGTLLPQAHTLSLRSQVPPPPPTTTNLQCTATSSPATCC